MCVWKRRSRVKAAVCWRLHVTCRQHEPFIGNCITVRMRWFALQNSGNDLNVFHLISYPSTGLGSHLHCLLCPKEGSILSNRMPQYSGSRLPTVIWTEWLDKWWEVRWEENHNSRERCGGGRCMIRCPQDSLLIFSDRSSGACAKNPEPRYHQQAVLRCSYCTSLPEIGSLP